MPNSTDLRALSLAHAPEVEALLAAGFPDRPASFWHGVLQRLDRYAENRQADVPLGLGLHQGSELVGVALTPASLRRRAGGQVAKLVNLSSWTIRPDQRWRAGLMLRRLVADPGACYTDLSPTPVVMRMLPHVGMQAVSAGTGITPLALHAWRRSPEVAVLPLLAGAAVPAEGPSPDLLEGHRALGCVPLLLRHPGGNDLLVYRPRRLRGLPCAQLLYVHSHDVLQRCLPALARSLMARGLILLECEVRDTEAHRWHTWLRPRGVWFAKGDTFAGRTDFLGSERCILGI